MRNKTKVEKEITAVHEKLAKEYDKGYLNINEAYIDELWQKLDELRIKWRDENGK